MVCGQVNRCDDRFVYRRNELRGLGVMVSLFAIIEFGIGGAVAQFFTESPVASSWWTSGFMLVAGSTAMSSTNKGLVMVACISASIGVLAGLSGSVTESAIAKIFEKLLSCGTFKAYPPSINMGAAGYSGNINIFGSSSTYNTTTWCMYQAAKLSKYSTDGSSCYCSFDAKPAPLATRTYMDTCEPLQFSNGKADCQKIFTTFTPNLKASAGITALLTGRCCYLCF